MSNILLLEPDSILATLYMRAFEHVGHNVRRTVSAQDAVFQVDEEMPHIVVVELQLVSHSGIEFLHELRSYSEWQRIPVIIHSCVPPTEFTDSMNLLRGSLGVRQYLYKPHTSLQKLLRSIDEVTSTLGSDIARVTAGPSVPTDLASS